MTDTLRLSLLQQFVAVRAATEELISNLSAEDMVVQSMPDASPTKWHLAHTTWFFEQFILKDYLSNYTEFEPDYNYLFNSYYENIGKRHARPMRGMLTRPGIDEILAYREAINETIIQLLDSHHSKHKRIEELVTLGLHHEMQHQELLMTDILHAFSLNPLLPALNPDRYDEPETSVEALSFHSFEPELTSIGAHGDEFYFDCEGPRHSVYVHPFALANRPVSNREWLDFIHDGGYQTPTLWLSDGWHQVQKEQWRAPLYWQKNEGHWQQFTLSGLLDIDADAPVCHISYFEADAFARWAGYRLVTEQEWEVAARQHSPNGNYLEAQRWRPSCSAGQGLVQLYGDVWEWTASPYSPYPGFKIAEGAVGEYNGKFMCGQYVLRGGSCVTPAMQIRPSYRNFFYPHQRWQFTGMRLAKDL
ncbi:ergothioneine biosynthesis protein EgtB [Gynuella sunshinyii]|uniref:Ergothioneine biosynthesis protein EgtB n=1 Tax=Gynuella sunshinyii YC6258 TaxID=1445510 RepID=A0A0C5VGE7_9GAMM|nr:ergothioneine biosynthesis protein EgtB [Gynuella sunshinyii]AJQ93677.1 hypothetical protein YC6258_01629 [Gynuella sunshinyii YC6258]